MGHCGLASLSLLTKSKSNHRMKGIILLISMAGLRGLGRDDVSCIICLCTFAAVFEGNVCVFLKSVVFDLLCFGYILLIQLDGGWALLIKLTRLFGYRKLPRSKI